MLFFLQNAHIHTYMHNAHTCTRLNINIFQLNYQLKIYHDNDFLVQYILWKYKIKNVLGLVKYNYN